MKQWSKIAVVLLMLLALTMQLCPGALAVDSAATKPTGYTKAKDVDYEIVGGTVVNWGAREEDCTFLSTYAQAYYTGSYSWSVLSQKDGGTGTSNAYTSQLYKSLQSMMKSKHTNIQGYQDTRAYYCYTDCVRNDYSKVSSFYSGKLVSGVWDSGNTYNREHIWPRSKCVYTDKTNDSADIMMLRATISTENSSRGNKAYGETGGFFVPDASVRGDCARMVLYGYVRWGNTSNMWGNTGVIESLDILLKWMEEDPVDTWEMGRNDAVQSITGVRNVFVDYPEYAWLLFGREIPQGMTTPSGQTCNHKNTQVKNQKEATCGASGYSGDTYCTDCGKKVSSGKKISATGKHSFGDWVVTKEATMEETGTKKRTCGVCGKEEKAQIPKLETPPCEHANTELRGAKDVTCAQDGYSGDTYCTDCGLMVQSGSTMEATGNHAFGDWTVTKEANGSETGERNRQCSVCNLTEIEEIPLCQHEHTERREVKDATCATAGFSGDLFCTDCGDLLEEGTVTRATGLHSYGQWVETEEASVRTCTVCGRTETVHHEKDDTNNNVIWIVSSVAATAVVSSVVVILIAKKKKK